MNKSGGIKPRSGVVDLTATPSNFQPQAGAKRLVIKNLRRTPVKDIDQYYEKTWTELDAALTSIFNREQPCSPLEVLCRGVEAICRRGRAELLFRHYKQRCEDYLKLQLLPIITREAGSDNTSAVRVVLGFWARWSEQSVSYHVL